MTPFEFSERFGTPVVRTVNLPAFGIHRVQPNPDRFLLVWWAASVVVDIYPDSQFQLSGSGTDFGPTSPPILLTHALHGSLVNMGWSVFGGGGPSLFTYIEGFIRSPKVTNGKRVPTLSRSSTNRRARQ